jgi:hypothetical protein
MALNVGLDASILYIQDRKELPEKEEELNGREFYIISHEALLNSEWVLYKYIQYIFRDIF